MYFFFLYFDNFSFILYILCSNTSFFSFLICFGILNISFCCSLLFSPSLQLSHAYLFALATSLFACFAFALYSLLSSSFCVLCHLLYALFVSCTALCTASFHHHVSLCILRCPKVTPHTSYAASKTFLHSCFQPPLFILFFCCTFTSKCLRNFSFFNFHSFIFFSPLCFFLFLGLSHLDLPSVGGVVLNMSLTVSYP